MFVSFPSCRAAMPSPPLHRFVYNSGSRLQASYSAVYYRGLQRISRTSFSGIATTTITPSSDVQPFKALQWRPPPLLLQLENLPLQEAVCTFLQYCKSNGLKRDKGYTLFLRNICENSKQLSMSQLIEVSEICIQLDQPKCLKLILRNFEDVICFLHTSNICRICDVFNTIIRKVSNKRSIVEGSKFYNNLLELLEDADNNLTDEEITKFVYTLCVNYYTLPHQPIDYIAKSVHKIERLEKFLKREVIHLTQHPSMMTPNSLMNMTYSLKLRTNFFNTISYDVHNLLNLPKINYFVETKQFLNLLIASSNQNLLQLSNTSHIIHFVNSTCTIIDGYPLSLTLEEIDCLQNILKICFSIISTQISKLSFSEAVYTFKAINRLVSSSTFSSILSKEASKYSHDSNIYESNIIKMNEVPDTTLLLNKNDGNSTLSVNGGFVNSFLLLTINKYSNCIKSSYQLMEIVNFFNNFKGVLDEDVGGLISIQICSFIERLTSNDVASIADTFRGLISYNEFGLAGEIFNYFVKNLFNFDCKSFAICLKSLSQQHYITSSMHPQLQSVIACNLSKFDALDIINCIEAFTQSSELLYPECSEYMELLLFYALPPYISSLQPSQLLCIFTALQFIHLTTASISSIVLEGLYRRTEAVLSEFSGNELYTLSQSLTTLFQSQATQNINKKYKRRKAVILQPPSWLQNVYRKLFVFTPNNFTTQELINMLLSFSLSDSMDDAIMDRLLFSVLQRSDFTQQDALNGLSALANLNEQNKSIHVTNKLLSVVCNEASVTELPNEWLLLVFEIFTMISFKEAYSHLNFVTNEICSRLTAMNSYECVRVLHVLNETPYKMNEIIGRALFERFCYILSDLSNWQLLTLVKLMTAMKHKDNKVYHLISRLINKRVSTQSIDVENLIDIAEDLDATGIFWLLDPQLQLKLYKEATSKRLVTIRQPLIPLLMHTTNQESLHEAPVYESRKKSKGYSKNISNVLSETEEIEKIITPKEEADSTNTSASPVSQFINLIQKF